MRDAVSGGNTFALKAKAEDSGLATVSILLVDDSRLFRTLVSSILSQQPGYQIVGEAADGPEAVQRAAELKPNLVVLDMGLPELNGVEVARQIRCCSPDSTILLLTGNNDPELARAALNAGARGYVLKADGVVELVEAVRDVLSGKQFVSRRLKSPV